MAGTVSTDVHLKGRTIHVARSYATGAEFKAALREVDDEARRLRDAFLAEKKVSHRTYRNKKIPKRS